MIGVGKIQSATGAAPSPVYSVSLLPGRIDVFSGNGSSTSPKVYSTVKNGVGPFEYLWTITGSDISINDDTGDNTSFSTSGFNSSYTEIATLTVTDTGNGDAQTSKSITVRFDFESGA